MPFFLLYERLMRMILLFLLFIVGALALTFTFAKPLWRSVGGAPFPPGGIDFARLGPTKTSNSYLLCPPGFCDQAQPQGRAVIYEATPEQVLDALLQLTDAEPGTALAYRDGLRLGFIQSSAVWKFPDAIALEILPDTSGGTSLAIYSRSLIGRSDLGVNKKRVQHWQTRLQSIVTAKNAE